MGAPGYFVAAGTFMIAAAILWGQALNRPSRDQGIPQLAALISVVIVLFLLAKGIQEQKKDKP